MDLRAINTVGQLEKLDGREAVVLAGTRVSNLGIVEVVREGDGGIVRVLTGLRGQPFWADIAEVDSVLLPR